MSSHFGPATTVGKVIFSFICVRLTGTALFCVIFFYFYYHNYVRRRAPVVVTAGARGGVHQAEEDRAGVDFSKLPEFAYSGSGDGAQSSQCPVCIGALQVGEMVRRLPICNHLYHVECIDMWLAFHATCPLCRSSVQPPVDGKAAGMTGSPLELPV